MAVTEVPRRQRALHEVIADPQRVWAEAPAGLRPLPLRHAFSVPLLHQATGRSRARGFTDTREPRELLLRGLSRLEEAGVRPRA